MAAMSDGGSTVASAGFALVGPEHPVERVVVGWPTLGRIDTWRQHLGAARDAFAATIRAIAVHEPVLVVADEGEGEAASRWIGEDVEVAELALDDCWIGDTAPFVVVSGTGDRRAVHTRFNGWGGRHPHERDAALGAGLARQLGLEVVEAPFVLEGGAISCCGDGTVVAIERSVCNPNRNGAVDRATVEGWLGDWLGVTRVVWLEEGLADDWGTDGHAANLVRGAGDGRVVLQSTTDASDPDWRTAEQARGVLADAGFAVTELDVLPHVQCFDQMVEVPYVNHLVTDAAAYVPLAGAAADHEMLGVLGDLYAPRRVVGVPGTMLAYGGGGVRSMACAIPAGVPPAAR